MSNPFFTFTAAAAARLNHGALVAVPRLTEDPQDPLNEAFKALYRGSLPANADGKCGVAIVIQTPDTQGLSGGTGLIVGEITLRVSIYELVALNRDPATGIGLAGADVLWLSMDRLHGWSPTEAGSPVEFTKFTSDEDPDRPGLLAYFADFKWTGGLADGTDPDHD